MSIYIKGMETPTSCSSCSMLEGDRMDGLCHAASRWLDDEEFWTWYVYPEGDMDDSKPCNCPLIPIPDHGRLIDADALVRDNGIKEIPEYYEVVCDAPTIIPADCKEERTVKWREWNTFVPASQADKVGGE